jgi:hypothetical protein
LYIEDTVKYFCKTFTSGSLKIGCGGMESIDLRSSLFWNVAHHMLVVTYQSFGEAIGLIFKDQEVHEKFQAADGSITT